MKIRWCIALRQRGIPAAIFRDRLREARDGSRQFVTYDWRPGMCHCGKYVYLRFRAACRF